MAPPTVLAAKFSIPHAVAAVAVLGDGGAASFAEHSLSDPLIASLRSRVSLTPHPGVGSWPGDRPATVTWEMRDGSRHSRTVMSARGGPDRPVEEEEILDKIVTVGRPAWPAIGDLAAELLSATSVEDETWAALLARHKST